MIESDSAGPGATRPVRVFVSQRGNRFMRDIATWIVDAACELGRTATLVDDRLPAPDGSVNLVVAPHEFYPLRDDPDMAVRAAAACSIPICTEQPGTPWFHLALGMCIGSQLVVDINAIGLDAIDRAGFDVHRLRLGGTATMDRWHSERASVDRHSSDRTSPDRDVDVVFLGGYTDRRAAALARLGPVLWDRHSEIRLFTFSRPLQGAEPGVVFGTEKYDLLARSKVLVNLHRSDEDAGYFEWARMVETMANGCVVVTEPSIGYDPLVPNEHFVEVEIADLAVEVVSLLNDEGRRARIAAAAYQAVMDEQPLAGEVGRLLERVDTLLDREERVHLGWRERVARARIAHRPVQRDHKPPLLPVFTPLRPARRAVYDELMAEIAHRRELGRFRALIEHGDPDHVDEFTTPAWKAPSAPADTADVGVVVTLYDYADVVVETLDSIVASTDVDLEIVIVDDHSADDGVDVVRRWMDEHPDTPVLLLACAANRGLPAARNLGASRVRADNVMMMDADNLVYPTCLRRLLDALTADPSASFAYATLEAFGPLPGLRSAQGWHVPWLCERNYIDAQAMIRRSVLERHGGYRTGESMYGWEDWELWLRLADAGEHGVHVPEMLGRYRTQLTSMIALTNLAAEDLLVELRARYPKLPWPA